MSEQLGSRRCPRWACPRTPRYGDHLRAADGSDLHHVTASEESNVDTVGIDPARGELAGPTIQEQMIRALTNCFAVLDAGGAGIDDVVEVGILLTNPDDFSGMNEAYATVFGGDAPARYVAKSGVVLPGVLVSIRMTAMASL